MSLTADSASGFYYSYEPNYLQYCSIAVRLVFSNLQTVCYTPFTYLLWEAGHTRNSATTTSVDTNAVTQTADELWRYLVARAHLYLALDVGHWRAQQSTWTEQTATSRLQPRDRGFNHLYHKPTHQTHLINQSLLPRDAQVTNTAHSRMWYDWAQRLSVCLSVCQSHASVPSTNCSTVAQAGCTVAYIRTLVHF